MGQTIYLECYSGISGDMVVAALLDLGADQNVLEKALASMPIQGYKIKIGRVSKSGLDSCDFDVVLDTSNDCHGMDFIKGKENTNMNIAIYLRSLTSSIKLILQVNRRILRSVFSISLP